LTRKVLSAARKNHISRLSPQNWLRLVTRFIIFGAPSACGGKIGFVSYFFIVRGRCPHRPGQLSGVANCREEPESRTSVRGEVVLPIYESNRIGGYGIPKNRQEHGAPALLRLRDVRNQCDKIDLYK